MVETQRHPETRELLCRVLGRELIAGDAEAIKSLTQKPQLCRILREHTDALTAIMKAGRQGQRSLGVLVDLVAMIDARVYPGNINRVFQEFEGAVASTGGQLVGIVELAKGAQNCLAPWIFYGILAAIKALGGNLTEGQLKQLVKLCRSFRDEAYEAMGYLLPPPLIEALGGNVTLAQLGRLVELAKASGDRMAEVIRYGLLAVIEALGGQITDGQLRQLGKLAKA